jgi:hypothetical protein
MRQALLAAVAAAFLVTAAPAGSTRALTIAFSFQGYANNVKVVAPLVGPYQLGVARIRGSGTLGGGVSGTVIDIGTPLYPRFKPASMRAAVFGYHYVGGAHGAFTKLTLNIEIVSAANGGPNCVHGTRGILTLYDSDAKLSNGETSDYIVMGHWAGAKCPGFVRGWTNDDGGARTRPTFGGPPDGGQWAVVRTSVS